VRHKTLALINILGLSIGLACFSLFLLYTINELSYDRFHVNASRIYRVYDWWAYSDHEGTEPSSATPLGPALKQDLSDVDDFVRIAPKSEKLIRVGNKLYQMAVTFADPQILSVFTFPLLQGNRMSALQSVHNIVLTRAKAMQFFGKTDVIGQTIEIRNGGKFEPFEVGGIVEDIPVNSSVRFDLLGSLEYILSSEDGRASLTNWNMTIGLEVYILLHEKSNLMNDHVRLASFRKKYFPEETIVNQKKPIKNSQSNVSSGYGIQPLRDVHTDVKIDKWGAVDTKNSWILICISLGVLVIACINFITLAISRSAGRAKEVGIRKITGSHRNQLIFQFLSESLLLSIFSAVLGFILAVILLPFFNELSGQKLSFSVSQYPEMVGFLSIVVLLVGLLSGIYPALAMSGFDPAKVLKSNLRFSGSNLFTRSLVSFQFMLSIGLIISMIVIMKQLSFMQSKDLGFDRKNIVMIDTQGIDMQKNYPLFEQALKSESSILGIAGSEIGLGEGEGQRGRSYLFGNKQTTIIEYPVDSEFLGVLGIQLVAGRNFNPGITSDTMTAVIVNEALVVSTLRIKPIDALGMEFINKDGKGRKVIIGVVRNFNYEVLTRSVRGQMFLYPSDFRPNSLFVRVNSGDPSKALSSITMAWNGISPELPVKYSFLDQKFDAFYKKEKRWGDIIAWAGGICIFLACLGLFGLTSLAVINRSKEIGIRKVNGAAIGEILLLLNNGFLKWIAISFVIATPLTGYAMNTWLESFAYKTDLSWWIFALAGLFAFLIALITVSWQSWKAATRNPVEALRYE